MSDTTRVRSENETDSDRPRNPKHLLKAHRYKRSRYSDAGNCWCGRDDRAKLHRPSKNQPWWKRHARFWWWTFLYRINCDR